VSIQIRRQRAPDTTIVIDGANVSAVQGETLAVALLAAGYPLGLFCGMGVCFVCQVVVEGRTVRACMERVRSGIHVETNRGGS
jgi:D-hydroxyproline dehydrogenase subunit gamma